jgi:hypothetical protein
MSLWECHSYESMCQPAFYYLGVALTALTTNWFICVLLSSTIEPPGCSLHPTQHFFWLPFGRSSRATCFVEILFAPLLIAG